MPLLLSADIVAIAYWILYCLLGLLFLVLIIYAITARVSILTTVRSNTNVVEGDAWYFLPTASITLKATAKVMIIRQQADNVVRTKQVIELALENTVNIEPDTDQVFSLKYTPFFFSNDELKVSTNDSGLLENISATAEDRLTAIVAQVADAASTLPDARAGGPGFAKEMAPASTLTVEIREFTRVFSIPPDKIKNASDKPDKLDWQVDLNDSNGGPASRMDLGFTYTFRNCPAGNAFAHHQGPFNGVLTRPLARVGLTVTWTATPHDDKPAITNESSILIPDKSRVIHIPIRRFAFVRNQFMPRFHDGLLIENYISKPSGAEALVSIPIRILKAIVSIPAEIFSFKVTHLRQETTLATEQANLLKAQAQLQQAGTQQQPRQPDGSAGTQPTGTAQPPTTPIPVKPAPAPLPQPTLPQLGKAPAPEVAPVKKIMQYVKPETLVPLDKATIRLDAPPVSVSWQDQVNLTDWNDYQNEKIKDCVPAAAAHLVMNWTANAKGRLVSPLNNDVLKAYIFFSKFDPVTGANNVDIRTTDLLRYWRDTGIGPDRILNFIPLRRKDLDELKQAVYLFGGAVVGLQLPVSAQHQNPWVIPADDSNGDRTPNSWGGHAVAVVGYDDQYITCITWGKPQLMNWDFYHAYNDESYAPLSPGDWINDRGLNPKGIDLKTLEDDQRNFGF